MRMSYEELNKIKDKYGVDILWSFSRLGCYENSPYNYYLKYIKREKEKDRSTIYTESGSTVHECLEQFYNKEILYEDMLTKYEDSLDMFALQELKYNKTDEEKNAAIANKYEADIRHFFRNHIPFNYKKCQTERFMITKVKDNIFQGYCDFIYKDEEGFINIVDFKSSTIYTGEKVLKEGK